MPIGKSFTEPLDPYRQNLLPELKTAAEDFLTIGQNLLARLINL